MRAVEFGEKLLTDLLDALVEAVPGSLGAGVSVLPAGADRGRPELAAAVGVAAELDPPQWADESSPLWRTMRSGTVLDTGDVPAGEGVLAGVWGAVGGLVMSPGEWGGEVPVVLSVYLEKAPTREDLAAIDRHEPLVTHALGFVRYCQGETERAEQMVQMTQYRRVIEQAKGLVMAVSGSSAETAFTTVSRASQHFNVPLRRLAVALVEHVGDSAVEHPEEGIAAVRPGPRDREVAAQVWAALSAAQPR